MIGDEETVLRMWSEGRQVLHELGLSHKLAGSMVGKWNRMYGAARTLAAIEELNRTRPERSDLIRHATQFFKDEWKMQLPGGAV